MLIVPWSGRLTSGTLLRRRHRFLLDVALEGGTEVVAHCISPGRMEGLVRPGARVWLSSSSGKGKTLAWTWELIEIDGTLICANSWTANKLVQFLLEARAVPGFKRFKCLDSEVRLARSSRIDFVLSSRRGKHFIEVKSVQQVYGAGISYFPDSKVMRSRAHIRALTAAIKTGQKATLLAVVQRSDAKCFRPSEVHDAQFCKELRLANKKGLNVRAILMEPTILGFKYRGVIPVQLAQYKLDDLTPMFDQLIMRRLS
jgi:sugar fermentation stimulation protein A